MHIKKFLKHISYKKKQLQRIFNFLTIFYLSWNKKREFFTKFFSSTERKKPHVSWLRSRLNISPNYNRSRERRSRGKKREGYEGSRRSLPRLCKCLITREPANGKKLQRWHQIKRPPRSSGLFKSERKREEKIHPRNSLHPHPLIPWNIPSKKKKKKNFLYLMLSSGVSLSFFYLLRPLLILCLLRPLI